MASLRDFSLVAITFHQEVRGTHAAGKKWWLN